MYLRRHVIYFKLGCYLPIFNKYGQKYGDFFQIWANKNWKRLNLFDMIRNDLKRKKISNSLRSILDFDDLRAIANDRVKWKSFEKR